MQYIRFYSLVSSTRAFQGIDISFSDKVFGPEEYDLKAPIGEDTLRRNGLC